MRSSRMRFRGTPAQVGREIGQTYGRAILESLEALRACFRHDGLAAADGAVIRTWFEALPARYREELQGVADALGRPVLELVETCAGYEQAPARACTSFLASHDGRPWVGRNNDYLLPGWWDHVLVRDIDGCRSTMLFGLPGDAFSGTGVNEERLWLHYNWLPALEPPGPAPRWTPFVWLRQALETCASLADVERLLSSTERDGGMALFAVDGKSGAAALFECSCRRHARTDLRGEPLVAANHYRILAPGAGAEESSSGARQDRLERTLRAALERAAGWESFPPALAEVALGDEGGDRGTVYSVLADPGAARVWYVADGFPAPVRGRWAPVAWPW